MSNQVYANNMEVSCKAAAGKSICAFPDVCFTPPTTPATPPGVPIPYPNTGMASDTTSGSTSVKISGKEVMLKNKSYFKKSMGDEAGCAPKKGVITSKNMGKVYFTKWSMDVKAEGENVVRNLDLTTHNHDRQLFYAEAAHDSAANDCLRARRCMLVPYSPTGKQKGCCGNKRQTGHHLIEASAFFDKGRGGSGSNPLAGCGNYSEGKAPSVCTEGTDHGTGTHGLLHTWQSDAALACPGTTGQNAVPKLALDAPGLDPAEAAHVTTYEQARENGIAAMQQVFPESNCDADCLRAQLDAYHVREAKIPPESRIQAVATTQSPDINEVWDMAKSKLFG
jgi:hypothetical protein